MHVLVVSAEPSPISLNASLRARAVERLIALGHTVAESNLVELGWNPVVTAADYGREAFAAPVGDTSAEAGAAGTLAPDIVAEQEKLGAADALVLVFPLWWYGMPAILKGWFDRVFLDGFAYNVAGPDGQTRRYGDGGLAGKWLLTIVSAGDRVGAFGPRGLDGDIRELLFPLLHGTAWYTGMLPLEPLLIASADHVGQAEIGDVLARVDARVGTIATDTPIAYRPLNEREYTDERLLNPEFRPDEGGLSIHEY